MVDSRGKERGEGGGRVRALFQPKLRKDGERGAHEKEKEGRLDGQTRWTDSRGKERGEGVGEWGSLFPL